MRRLYLFYFLFCAIFQLCFGFFANFPTLFLAEMGLFHSLGLLRCSVWLGEVKVILLQQCCYLFKVDSCSVNVECVFFRLFSEFVLASFLTLLTVVCLSVSFLSRVR